MRNDAVSTAGQTAAVEQLRASGLRVTRPRLAVLQALTERPHSDTAAVIDVVRARLDVSHQAVYDVLGALTDAGLVRRIQPAGSLARYEIRRGDNHHHIVCRSCGSVADVPCAVGAAPCLDAQEDHGYAIEEAEVIYWGLCPTCSAQPASEPSEPSQPHESQPTASVT